MIPPTSDVATHRRSSRFRALRMLLVAIAFIGSLALNVLTVVNEAVHEAAFSMVKATSTLLVGEVRATKVLGASPAQKYAMAALERTEAVKRSS